uniref:Uncharacterized protein n=1 Tax=Anguilla anguilla TaxID=7936 RepID=A0A0E9V860_ANGAN
MCNCLVKSFVKQCIHTNIFSDLKFIKNCVSLKCNIYETCVGHSSARDDLGS